MSNKPIIPRSVNENEKLMRQKFYENLTQQSELVDKMSGHLLTLELAIPGVYAAVLKLVRGDAATLPLNAAFYITFACWLVALVLTFIALTPKKWQVDVSVLKQDPQKMSEGLGIEDFFEQSAQYKLRFVIASSVLFFIGIFSAAFTIG